jgi:hypothetical protein
MRARVIQQLRVRSSPEISQNNFVRMLQPGTIVSLLPGTADVDGFRWRRIAEREWCAEQFLEILPADATQPAQPTQATQPAQPVQPTQPTQPPQQQPQPQPPAPRPTQQPASTQPTQPMQPAQPTQPTQPPQQSSSGVRVISSSTVQTGTATQPPPPPPAQPTQPVQPVQPVQPTTQTGAVRGGSKIGFHIHVGNNANAVIDLYKRMHDGGTPITVAKVINDTTIVNRIKQVSPSTFVVFRGNIGVDHENFGGTMTGDRARDEQQGYERFKARYIPCNADAFQVANEWYNPGQPEHVLRGANAFYLGAMRAAAEAGVRITVGDFSYGTPEDHHLDFFAEMFTRARERGDVLNFHSYAHEMDFRYLEDWLAMRWRRITARFPLRVFIGEAAQRAHNAGYLGQQTLELMKQLHSMIKDSPQVIGACWYTANGAFDWAHSSCDALFPDFAVWHSSTR